MPQQLCLAADDGDAGFKIRRLDVRRKAPFKPGEQALFQGGDVLGRTVGCEHDLLVGLI